MLPDPLACAAAALLERAGDSSPLRAIEAVSGGYANQAARLTTGNGSYLLKWDPKLRLGIFPTEARGLEMLRQLGVIRLPAVLAAVDPVGETPGFILEEWIEPQPVECYWRSGARYGERLARLHQAGAARSVPRCGLDHDNYVGNTPQSNSWHDDWVSFYRNQRLRPLVDLAARMELLSGKRRDRLERLMERLGEWLGGVERQPVLLHGDLWRGNVLFDSAGEPVLIDPAVCWGDREFDLATVAIYEPAPDDFYEAYHSVWPIAPAFAERLDLHNLYLLLCCLTDGDEFGARIDGVLQRYVG